MKTEGRFNLFLSPRHASALNLLAEERGEKTSGVLRQLIREEALRAGVWDKPIISAPTKPKGEEA